MMKSKCGAVKVGPAVGEILTKIDFHSLIDVFHSVVSRLSKVPTNNRLRTDANFSLRCIFIFLRNKKDRWLSEWLEVFYAG